MSNVYTERFTDFGNINLPLIFNTAPAALINNASFKCGQNWPKNNDITLLI